MRFHPETGEITEDEEPPKRPDLRVVGCPECEKLKAIKEADEARIRGYVKDLEKKRAEIERLLDRKERDRQAYARREEVELWFDVWRTATKHPKSKLTAPRFDTIKKLIEVDYTVEQWGMACDYVGALPFVHGYERKDHGTEKQRHDDVDLIARKLEKYARLEWERRRA